MAHWEIEGTTAARAAEQANAAVRNAPPGARPPLLPGAPPLRIAAAFHDATVAKLAVTFWTGDRSDRDTPDNWIDLTAARAELAPLVAEQKRTVAEAAQARELAEAEQAKLTKLESRREDLLLADPEKATDADVQAIRAKSKAAIYAARADKLAAVAQAAERAVKDRAGTLAARAWRAALDKIEADRLRTLDELCAVAGPVLDRLATIERLRPQLASDPGLAGRLAQRLLSTETDQ